MKVLTTWLRSYLPDLPVSDAQLAEDLTLRGIAVEGVFDLALHGVGAGSLFEMDITTNRVDAMNHYGIAREAAVIYGVELKPLETELPPAAGAAAYPVLIEEDAQGLCGRFTARVLRGITVQPSSGIVAERFRLLEQKLISNAVDATNYVTQAIGQPTHAFDLERVTGGIIVRRARWGERLRTLDGVERSLDPDDMVIADEEKALSIAGVMGGWDSMITASTKNVLVEAAWFDPATIRRSSKRHCLHTDASHRFERGADFNAGPVASAMVSRILLESGGHLESELVDIIQPEVESRTARRSSVSLAVSEVRRILGPTDAVEGITSSDVETILVGLGCTLAAEPNEQSRYAVSLPSWRLDLEREIDLIEEVARVYGYNRFLNTLPVFTGTVKQQPNAAAERATRQTLLAAGLSEAVSSTFCSAADAATFAPQPGSAAAIENPLSEEAGMLRPSLVPGMLTMLAANLHRDVGDIALFEMGTVFTATGTSSRGYERDDRANDRGGGAHEGGSTNEKIAERPSLAIGLAGQLGERAVDFYTLKGIVAQTAARFAARMLYYDRFPAESGLMPGYLHPGQSARLVIDGTTIGYFGQLHPEEAARRKLKSVIYLGELRLDRLYAQGLRHPIPRELSRFQPVRRDFSFLLPEATLYAQVEQAVDSLGLEELTSLVPAELLGPAQNPQVPEGYFSLLLKATFQSTQRTLREDDLQSFAEQLVTAVATLGGRLRS